MLLEQLSDGLHLFPDRVTKAVIHTLSIYPFHEYVVLNAGEVGRVVEINSENPMFPVIEVLYGPDGEPLETPKPVDLALEPWQHITQVVAEPAPARSAHRTGHGHRTHAARRMRRFKRALAQFAALVFFVLLTTLMLKPLLVPPRHPSQQANRIDRLLDDVEAFLESRKQQ